ETLLRYTAQVVRGRKTDRRRPSASRLGANTFSPQLRALLCLPARQSPTSGTLCLNGSKMYPDLVNRREDKLRCSGQKASTRQLGTHLACGVERSLLCS